MLIRTRLALIFSVITSILLILFGASVYYYASAHRQKDFLKDLKKRVEITEKIFLEKDAFNEAEYEKIKEEFLHTLPDEKEEVVELNRGITPEFQGRYPADLTNELIKEKELEFQIGEKEGYSRIFHVNGKDFLIIVTAQDVHGKQYLSDLKNIILILLLFGVPLAFVSSYFITRKTLMPVSKKIERANSISASNLDQRLEVVNSRNELGQMAIAFNHLLERLEKSFESQKAFIRNASHEIRTPLTAILGETEITLNRSRKEEEYRKALENVQYEAEILNETVNNLLELSKVQSGEEGINMQEVRLKDLLKKVIESYKFQNPKAIILWEDEESDNLEAIRLLANRNLLASALTNVLDNASKFSKNKPVRIQVESVPGRVSINISDKGIGINPEDIESIGKPFFRGSNVWGIRGSGIGLSLSMKVINLHKGSIVFYSKKGKGTRVTIELPIL